MTRKILIADPDFDAARNLSKALRQRGYQVHYAPDGSKALEVSVLRHPDLTLFDDACRMIEAKTFVQILRTNPRTEDIPVVLTLSAYDADKVHAFRDGYLSKPYNVDEVLSRIEHIFRRSEAAQELKGEAKEIEGTLTQLSIPDLLQILAMNRRSGRLNLVRASERGEIQVQEGRPVNAKVGPVEGEKALFRLLAWNEGTFAFVHGGPAPRVRITRAMDDALLEGLRQSDEVARLSTSLPPRNAHISLAPDADLANEQHPVTAQVVELLKQSRTLADLLDLTLASDLEVMVVLGTLLEKGMARVAEAEQSEGRPPLLGPSEVHALRSRLFRGRMAARGVIAKVFVLGNAAAAGRRLLREMSSVTRVSADPDALRSGFGTLGQLEVSEGLKIDFCLLPASEAARPLWRPFCSGAVGALLLDTSGPALKLARYFGWELRLPLVVLADQVPEAIAGAPGGSFAAGPDLAEALRALLLRSLEPIQPDAIGASEPPAAAARA